MSTKTKASDTEKRKGYTPPGVLGVSPSGDRQRVMVTAEEFDRDYIPQGWRRAHSWEVRG